jgi:hypothetical protein
LRFALDMVVMNDLDRSSEDGTENILTRTPLVKGGLGLVEPVACYKHVAPRALGDLPDHGSAPFLEGIDFPSLSFGVCGMLPAASEGPLRGRTVRLSRPTRPLSGWRGLMTFGVNS